MKKTLFLLLTMVLLPLSGWCADGDTFTITTTEGLTMTMMVLSEADKTCQVGDGSDHIKNFDGTISIPAEANGYTVTSIGSYAFYGCSALKHVNIPSSVTILGEKSFSGCGLTGITLHEGLTEISDFAFSTCTELEDVSLPESLTRIGMGAFNCCYALKSIDLPSHLTSIGSGAFFATALTSVVLPNSVTELGYSVFSGCEKLTSFTFSTGLTSTGKSVLIGCSSITNVVLPEGMTGIDDSAFRNCTKLTSVTMPSTMSHIGKMAFYNCSSLTKVDIPEGITMIDEYAYAYCKNIETVTLPSTLTGLQSWAFYCPEGQGKLRSVISRMQNPFDIDNTVFYNYETVTLYVPKGLQQKYRDIYTWNLFQNIVEMEESPTAIEPVIADGKTWTMYSLPVVAPENESTIGFLQVKLGNTMEMDGVTFHQIVFSEGYYGQNEPSDWKETGEYIGESDGKVYLYDKWSEQTVQVMDFTLSTGDTYRQLASNNPNDGYEDFVVTAVSDTIIALSSDKTPRKCLYLSRKGSNRIDDVWIEGIGSLTGSVYGAYIFLSAGAIPSLKTCETDDQLLYEVYHPLLKEGKTWNYEQVCVNIWDDSSETEDVSYVVSGTIEIENKTYYKMYRVAKNGSRYYCALREEGRQVWVRNEGEAESLLYDFGMAVGDSYMPLPYDGVNIQLADVKPVRFRNRVLDVLDYYNEGFIDFTIHLHAIEGIGCEAGWDIREPFMPIPTNGIFIIENFKSCFEDGVCIFRNEDFSQIPTGISCVQTAKRFLPSGMYNLQGQRLSEKPKHGIFIRGGRKYLVK